MLMLGDDRVKIPFRERSASENAVRRFKERVEKAESLKTLFGIDRTTGIKTTATGQKFAEGHAVHMNQSNRGMIKDLHWINLALFRIFRILSRRSSYDSSSNFRFGSSAMIHPGLISGIRGFSASLVILFNRLRITAFPVFLETQTATCAGFSPPRSLWIRDISPDPVLFPPENKSSKLFFPRRTDFLKN